MTTSDVIELARKGIFQGKPLHGNVEETHISWVILAGRNAFKIKKPLKLSFLNFSTLERRKHFCEREFKLNSRFSDIYQGVVPIRAQGGKWYVGSGHGKVMDYAVQMKRLLTSRRMDNMLRADKVGLDEIEKLARVIAAFHISAEKVFLPFDHLQARKTFNDISGIRNFVEKQLGPPFVKIISQSIQWSNRFLKAHAKRIQQRIERGFKRDVHGDLHSGNIFLYRNPVLFDCIEFNERYRQIDVLYEVAFLCMDLERFSKKSLSNALLSTYTSYFPCFEEEEDEHIFVYFKCLRANVRAKVHAMSAALMQDTRGVKRHSDEVKKYLMLMKAYMNE